MKRVGQLDMCDADARVFGQSMVGFLNCLTKESVIPVLEKYGLKDVDPEAWYPLQVWVDIMRDLSKSTYDLVSVGMKMMEYIPWPPGFDQLPFHDILASMDVTYQANHKGEVGAFNIQPVDDHHAVIDVNVPYPDDLVYGAYWQICRRFLPAGTQFVVEYDQSEPLRKDGGHRTLIHIKWD